ncbi:hypothetical protein NECID01_1515 [Nematocida sp. AWRm77]|nr:hypothetical protein NECID01_1515 [Nematocida sp. AWRm77]
MRKARRRETPPYEKGDLILTNTTEIEKELLSQISPESTLVVVDKPAEKYLEKVRQDTEELLGKERVSEDPARGVSFCTLADFKREKTLHSAAQDYVFVNIRSKKDKKSVTEKMHAHKKRYFFLSNAYKIEKTDSLEHLGINRVLPKKEDFGLLRSARSFGRTHEVIFGGDKHLKDSACTIAIEQEITIPCIVAVEKEEDIERVCETVEKVKALEGKTTADISEYLQKKKWVYVATYSALLKGISTSSFSPLREATQSILSYDATDKSAYLLSMHQLSLQVFSLCTTQDRGKVLKILDTLPQYGINLGEKAIETAKQRESSA